MARDRSADAANRRKESRRFIRSMGTRNPRVAACRADAVTRRTSGVSGMRGTSQRASIRNRESLGEECRRSSSAVGACPQC